MKRKLLCVAVALVMILPLAFAAIPTSMAAVYTDLVQPWTVSVASSTAGLDDADGSFVLNAPAWTGSSITSKLPLRWYNDSTIFATSITIPHQTLADDTGKDAGTCYQYISVMIADQPVTATPVPGGVPGCAPLCDGNSLEFRMVSNLADEVLFYFYYNGGCISSGVALADKVIAGINAGDTVGFEFVVNGASVDLYANGSVIFTYVGISSLFTAENGVYAAYTASAYGGNATGTVVVTDINDMVPSDYSGFIVPWTAAGNAAINADGSFTVSAPAWAGGAIYSTKAVPFDSSNAIYAQIAIPHTAHVDDTGMDGTVCFQNFSFAIGSALTSAAPGSGAPSCNVSGEGTTLEIKLAATVADDVLVYFFKNGTCVNPANNLADLIISGVTAGSTVEFSYYINGDDVVVSADGVDVFTFTGAAADFAADGVAGVCFAASSYGGNVTPAVDVVTFQSFAPTWFSDYREFHVEPPFEPGEDPAIATPVDPANVNWTTLEPMIIPSAGAAYGTVTYQTNGNIVLDATAGTWWPQATTVYNNKVVVSQTSVTFNKGTFSDMSYNGYFGIFFYKKSPVLSHSQGQDSVCLSLFGARTYAPFIGNGDNVTGVMFGGDSRDAAHAFGGWSVNGEVYFDNAYTDGVDTTISVGNVYEKDGRSYVKIAINGQTVQLGGSDYEFDVTNVLDANGKTSLVLTAQGYGGSGGTVTVKKVNGIAAGLADAKSELDNRPAIMGAQYRTTGAAGIRSGTQLPKAAELGTATVDATNGTVTFANVAKFGTLVMPLDKLNGNATYLRHTTTGTINGVAYLDIECEKFYRNYDESIQFTAVLIGIPAGMEDRQFVAVSYVEYNDGTVVYSAPCVRSINQIASASELNYNA